LMGFLVSVLKDIIRMMENASNVEMD